MISRGAEIEEIEAYAREQQGMRSLEGKGSGTGKTGVTTPEELLRIAYTHNRKPPMSFDTERFLTIKRITERNLHK